ncbi:MAG: hypothetical protein J7M08_05280 [Planctomycetes bacterium]|nr:hypothetical protein [Planctomycetota bacterium]
MTPAKVLCVMLLGVLLALCVLRQSALMRQMGYRIERLQAQMERQQTERARYMAHISRLKSPRRIVGLIAWLGLDLQESRPPERPRIPTNPTEASSFAVAEMPQTMP